ncbi:MAG: hypothetical protein ACI9DK_001122 [Vicingaceae bacterium]|jgi:hypothetical protein
MKYPIECWFLRYRSLKQGCLACLTSLKGKFAQSWTAKTNCPLQGFDKLNSKRSGEIRLREVISAAQVSIFECFKVRTLYLRSSLGQY